MNLKNYTTSIAWEKTIQEIETMLSQMGADAIMKEYRGDSRVKALNFRLNVDGKPMGFKLPAETEKAFEILRRQRGFPRDKIKGEQQADRVVWRIIKDWLYSQFSLVQIGQAKAEQVFLPYAYDGRETLYEKWKSIGSTLQIQRIGTDVPSEVQRGRKEIVIDSD